MCVSIIVLNPKIYCIILYHIKAHTYTSHTHTNTNTPLSVVDGVSEAGRVYDGELQLDPFLLDVHRVLGDLHCLADALCKTASIKPRYGSLIFALSGQRTDLLCFVMVSQSETEQGARDISNQDSF